MKLTIGTIRLGRVVESRVTGKTYPVRAIRAFGEDLLPGSKRFSDFLEMTPRCVTITGVVDDGVRVEIGVGLKK
jgi:hypothetical protein